MNGCIFPGRMISCAGAAGFGRTTETEGTAICAVTVRKLASAVRRDRIPKTRTAKTATPTITGMTQLCWDGRAFSGFGFNGTISTLFSVSLISKLVILAHLFLLFRQCSLLLPSVQQAEKCWNEEECRNRSEEKAADHCSSQRSILFAPVAETQRHGHHANDHCQSRH